jgi:hypothetical protein
MKSYSEFMPAGVKVPLTIGGRLLYIQRSSGGAVLDITFHSGAGTQTVSAVGKGFKAGPVGGFDTITFKAAQDTTVEFIVTDGDVNAQFDDANTIIGNDDGQALPVRVPAGTRLPVDIDGGNFNLMLNPQSLMNILHPAPVAVGLAVVTASNDITLKRLRFRNTSATAHIALGGAAVGMDSPILLGPGDVYMEDDAAGAHWYAIADEAGAQLTIMGLK